VESSKVLYRLLMRASALQKSALKAKSVHFSQTLINTYNFTRLYSPEDRNRSCLNCRETPFLRIGRILPNTLFKRAIVPRGTYMWCFVLQRNVHFWVIIDVSEERVVY
jgi:hypothetical protein